MGVAQTSSAFSPTTNCSASRSKARPSMPRPKAWSSPTLTGSVGFPNAKHEQMSVPPLMEANITSDLTLA